VPTGRKDLEILLVSVLGLFYEVLLIRWVGTEVRIFAYLQNTVLVVCFLGLGAGAFWHRRPVSPLWMIAPAFAFGLLLAVPWTHQFLSRVPDLLSPLASEIAWVEHSAQTLPSLLAGLAGGILSVLALMVVVAIGFVPIGQILGRAFDEHPRPLRAYSWNVLGSLVGVWGFALASLAGLGPTGWIVITGVLMVPFLAPRAPGVALVALSVGLVFVGGRGDRVIWSPYQKLEVQQVARVGDPNPLAYILVNNTGYQAMFDLRPEVTRTKALYTDDRHGLTQYDIPFLLHDRPDHVLVSGAGSGNDVSGALRNGAIDVVAVDIDPAILAIGKEHPERPYDDPAVHAVVNDARNVFATIDQRFDVVYFGLLDAHTTTALSSARLDHFVYTAQSIAQARKLLKPDGLMTLTFAPQHPWIVDRIARTLKDEFGTEPLFFEIPNDAFGFGGVMFVAGNLDMAHRRLDLNPRLKAWVVDWRAVRHARLGDKTWEEYVGFTTRKATDDWPYLYLAGPKIPSLFFVLAVLVALTFGAVRRVFGWPGLVQRRWGREHWHFAFLGAAFLLLETGNIAKAAVVLGNTWLVSAIIISGVLVMVLLANAVVARWSPPIPIVGALLVASTIGLYFLDLSVFLGLPSPVRAVVTAGLTCAPMFCSGMLFADSFSRAADKSEALGANLIGSLAGGVLQSITYLTGLRFLLLLTAAAYVAALLTRRRDAAALPTEIDEAPSIAS
jgi:spermidine synthase